MFSVILITAKDKAQAQLIADKLLREKLAACVNIIETIESHFWWQGKVDQASESLLIVKSRKEFFSRVEAAVKAVHSYDVPEIIALDIAAGSPEYLKWIDHSI